MTNKDSNSMDLAAQASQLEPKKPYQTPELTVHGQVNQITRFLPFAHSHP